MAYIDRDAFIARYRDLYCTDCDSRKGMKNGKLKVCYEIGGVPCRACRQNDVLTDLEDYPAADVRPIVCGKWVERRYWRPSTMNYGCIMYACSECGNELSYDAETGMWATNWNFCPNCGADLRRMKPDG